MDLGSSTVLVTGGGSGIGLALAERLLAAGSDVVLCGRREERLRAVKAKHPKVDVYVCDLGDPAERVALAERVVRDRPRLDVLVNNAGIQQRPRLADSPSWDGLREEIAINLDAPIHLTTLLLPHLLKQARPAVVNVTSGLSFVPKADVPVYCATKAALHSFTLSLRHQLVGTPVEVVEIIPPAVNTDLGGPGLHTFGVPLDEFADFAFAGLQKGDLEIAHAFSAQTSQASRKELDQIFERMNNPGR